VSGISAAAGAYVWGYPLVVMHRTRALHCSRVPLGQLRHVDDLATPADRSVVAPNNDTLYSSGWFDLRAGDITVEVEPLDRYWNVMVLDAYTNVSYVCRRLHGSDGTTVRLTLDPATPPPDHATDVLPIGTPTIWVLVRTLVAGPDDLDAARARQRRIHIATPPGHPDHHTERIGRPNQVHHAGAAVFDELAAALAVDPPAAWHPQPDPSLWGVLDGAVDEDGLAEGARAGEHAVAGHRLGFDRTRNGWATSSRSTDFGDDVLRRASVAKYGLAGHRSEENRSYVGQVASDGERLDGRRPLALRFAPDEPPCAGFWSLTAYGPDMFLVENELERYALGDRTPDLARDRDGGLTVTIGHDRPADVRNWLPTPEGPYVLVLRVYEGAPEVVAADWFPGELRC
jgi:hypothetical protein